MNVFDKAHDSYVDRKFLYLFPHTSETYCAVNYDAVNSELNSFLSLFDVWGNKNGHHKVSEDGDHQEIWFEVDEEFYKLAMENKTFRRAIERLGVKITTEYPFKKDPLTDYWKGMHKTMQSDFAKIALGWDLAEEED